MTCRELLMKEHPGMVNPRFSGGCCGCPYDYGYANNYCVGKSCEECWEQEAKIVDALCADHCNLPCARRIPVPVLAGEYQAPRCPICGSAEYMQNPDGQDNDYCGQCGCKLDWKNPENEDEELNADGK